jgi:hypothetical protein
MSIPDRSSIKHLEVVNVCNNLLTVHSVQTRVVREVVRTMFIDPLTACNTHFLQE